MLIIITGSRLKGLETLYETADLVTRELFLAAIKNYSTSKYMKALITTTFLIMYSGTLSMKTTPGERMSTRLFD